MSVIDEVASVAGQTSAESENVSAAEEWTASLTEVTDCVGLSQRGDDFRRKLDRFALGDPIGSRAATVEPATGDSPTTADGGHVDSG